MSTPSSSVAPQPITPTDPTVIAGETSVVRLGKRVWDWIAGLSPAGATAYDTGWGQTPTATGTGTIHYRRIGRRVQVDFDVVSASIAANTWVILGTVPSGYRPARNAWGAGYTPSTPMMPIMAFIAANGTLSVRHTAAITAAQGTVQLTAE